MRLTIKFLTLAMMLGGGYLSTSALMVPAKAWLSVHLINNAWEKTIAGDENAKPWPWMDSTPVARIEFPDYDENYVVMSGISGSVMAFAPGWHDGTAAPGQKGISLISAHKDTHFSFLKNFQGGEEVILTKRDGSQKHYFVESVSVVSEPSIQIEDSHDESILVLSTCYPFNNWQVGGSLRFVAVARETPTKAISVAGL